MEKPAEILALEKAIGVPLPLLEEPERAIDYRYIHQEKKSREEEELIFLTGYHVNKEGHARSQWTFSSNLVDAVAFAVVKTQRRPHHLVGSASENARPCG